MIQQIDNVPGNRFVFIVDMLESLKAYTGEEIKLDEWDIMSLKR